MAYIYRCTFGYGSFCFCVFHTSTIISLVIDVFAGLYVSGGFSTFQERFPEYCQSQEITDNTILGLCNLRISDDSAYGSSESSGDLENTPHMSPFPVEVLPYLYLGNAKNSADLSQLKKNGIHYILNVTPNVPNMFEDNRDFKYLQIPISDHWSQNLSSFFPDAIAFIGKDLIEFFIFVFVQFCCLLDIVC